jgi:hypothetical protein
LGYKAIKIIEFVEGAKGGLLLLGFETHVHILASRMF